MLFNLLCYIFMTHPHHDDVIKWKYIPRYWPFVGGIRWSPVYSRHKGQWRRSMTFSLICAWTNGWTHHPDAGNLIFETPLHSSWRHCNVAFAYFLLSGIGIPIIKIRWPHERLIFIMEIPILGKAVFTLRRNLYGVVYLLCLANMIMRCLSNFRALWKV